MVFTAAAFVLAVAGSAVALPTSSERFAARQARRALGTQHKGNLAKPVQVPGSPATVTNSSSAHVEYDTNWAGSVISKSSATWTSIVGTFTVPTPSKPSGGSSSTQYAASAWVGIDGDTCDSAIWQTGVDFYVTGTSVSYDCWYEWYPDYADDFSGITFSAGDVVTLTITATSKTSGKATIDNTTKGKSVSKTISNSGYDLCEYDAEWIIEDFEECNSNGSDCEFVPLANWGSVTFSNAVASGNGVSEGPSSGAILDIRQPNTASGTVYSSVSTTSTSVTITYK